ncbi:MAG: hypothetical protein M3371_08280 [Acidobacteriota bacterium]|nr:hypothetical protein [Acidobacteriota bacterium]
MNWETIIRHYNAHHRPNKHKELNWFRRQPSLEAVLSVAAKAENDRGLRYSHQYRITRKAIQEANRLLLEKHDELQRCNSFHELWLLIRKILKPAVGLGELYIYDTALRIGAYLNLLPDRVYLHAGTRTGAKAFGIVSQQKEWIDLDELPNILRELSAHEVEDILCIYKDKAVSSKGCA